MFNGRIPQGGFPPGLEVGQPFELSDSDEGSWPPTYRGIWNQARRDRDYFDYGDQWASTSGHFDPGFIPISLDELRKKFEPECKLAEPEPVVVGTQLIQCSDPVPGRKTPQRSPVIPKKELKLGLLKQKKCLEQVQPELINMASSRGQLESDAHPSYQDSFIVFSLPDGFRKIVIKSQDGLLSTLVRKEKLDERVLYVTRESLSEVKSRLSKARILNRQVAQELPKMEGIRGESLRGAKTDSEVRVRELTPTERALCPADCEGKNVFELSTRMFMLPPKLIDFEATIMPWDLDGADHGGQKYTVKIMWATFPHTYKARIKIEGDHLDAKKAKTVLKNLNVVSNCHHVNTKGGRIFSSDSWLRKGSELDIWFRSRVNGFREDDAQMASPELEHVIRMVLEVNNITMTTMSFSRVKENVISQKEAEFLINQRVARCAIHTGVWDWQERYTDSEWRTFFDRNIQKLPWKITNYQVLFNNDRDLSATVEFSSLPFAASVCNYILRHTTDNKFFQFDHIQIARTRFYCRYHSALFVPPEIRVLLNEDIKKLDETVRKTTDGVHSSWARIRDLPNSMISVEGWNREYVDDVVRQLQEKMKPEAFDCSTDSRSQLLYGCGLQLVNKQQERCAGRVFISVDRLNEKIVLIGDQPSIAGIKQCFLDFVDRPHNFSVLTSITIDPPMYLPIMKGVLDYNGEKALAELLGGCMVKFQKPNQLLFEGSVHQYNQLRLLLDKTQYEVLNTVSEKIISKRAKEQFVTTFQCPVCTAPYSFDKYRIACGHAYCLQCLTLLIKHSLGSGEIPIRCVLPRCQKPVGIRDIMSLLFDEKSLKTRNFFPERLEPLFKAANRAAAKADDLIPCIKAGCEGFLERAEKEYIRTINCPICRTVRCSTCTNPPHVGRSCEQEVELRSNDELAIEHYIKSRRDNVKKCPTKNCEALIQKEEGCNHMHCTFCKIHFCWTCLFSAITQQEVYAHMQKKHGGTGGEWGHLDIPPGFGPPGFGVQGFGGVRPPVHPPGMRRPIINAHFFGNFDSDSDSD